MAITEQKKMVLTTKLNNVVYELAVRTISDMVYINNEYTLTEFVNDITTALEVQTSNTTELSDEFKKLMKDAPETFRTLKEIHDYIGSKPDPTLSLIDMLDTKVPIEIGKGLSTNDFTDGMKEMLTNLYENKDVVSDKMKALEEKFQNTVDEINDKVENIQEQIDSLHSTFSTIVVTSEDTVPDELLDKGFWYQVKS